MPRSYCRRCMPVQHTWMESNSALSTTRRLPPDPIYTLIDKTSGHENALFSGRVVYILGSLHLILRYVSFARARLVGFLRGAIKISFICVMLRLLRAFTILRVIEKNPVLTSKKFFLSA
jgi:hypothetical protein